MIPTVAIPDLHAPYHSKRGLKRTIEFIGDVKPGRVVQVGDLFDQLSASRHPHSRNNMSPEEELNTARAVAVGMWAQIRRAVPKAKLYQIRGNHDARIAKRVMEVLPEVESLVIPAVRELYEFEGVQSVHSEWDELILDNVVYMHGFKKFGDHVKWNNMNTVHGHDHVGNIKWVPSKTGAMWEMSAGFLGEIDSPAFGYRNQKLLHGWTLGLGYIDTYGPRFVSFDR